MKAKNLTHQQRQINFGKFQLYYPTLYYKSREFPGLRINWNSTVDHRLYHRQNVPPAI